jgi:hypothetical protein
MADVVKVVPLKGTSTLSSHHNYGDTVVMELFKCCGSLPNVSEYWPRYIRRRMLNT